MHKMRNKGRLMRHAIAAALQAGMSHGALAAPGDPIGAKRSVASVPQSVDLYWQPAIARNRHGDMVVVWRAYSGVHARLLDRDGVPKGEVFQVGSGTAVPGLPDVAMDDDGNFVVVWEPMGGVAGVHAQRYHADGSVNGPVLQVTDALASSRQSVIQAPAVAMDADGDFVVAWAQGREIETGNRLRCAYGLGLCTSVGNYSVRARRYTSGGTQANAIQTVDSAGATELVALSLPLGVGNREDRVEVAMNDDNQFVVAWNRLSQGLSLASGVWSRRYNAAGVGELKRLVSAQRNQAMPSVAMDGNGAYAVTYRRPDRALSGGADGVYVRRFPAGTGLGAAEQRVDLGPTTDSLVNWPSIAMNPAGDFVVTWNANRRIYAQRYANGGGALGGNIDASGPAPAFDSYDWTGVASDGQGHFAVVWSESVLIGEDWHSGISVQLFEGP